MLDASTTYCSNWFHRSMTLLEKKNFKASLLFLIFINFALCPRVSLHLLSIIKKSSFIWTECAVIGRSHGELDRFTAHDSVQRRCWVCEYTLKSTLSVKFQVRSVRECASASAQRRQLRYLMRQAWRRRVWMAVRRDSSTRTDSMGVFRSL